VDADPLVVEEVGEEADHVEQRQARSQRQEHDAKCQGDEEQKRRRGGEVPERLLRAVVRSMVRVR